MHEKSWGGRSPYKCLHLDFLCLSSTLADKGQKLVAVLYEEQLYLLEEVNGKDPFQTSPRQKYMWCTYMRQKRELKIYGQRGGCPSTIFPGHCEGTARRICKRDTEAVSG